MENNFITNLVEEIRKKKNRREIIGCHLKQEGLMIP